MDYNSEAETLLTDIKRCLLLNDKALAVDILAAKLKSVASQGGAEALRHIHVNNQDGTDGCKECGLDLRNEIHLRACEV